MCGPKATSICLLRLRAKIRISLCSIGPKNIVNSPTVSVLHLTSILPIIWH